MQTATLTRGNKVARIKQVAIDLYKVVVAQASDLTEFGDVLAAREFKTAQGALRYANSQLK